MRKIRFRGKVDISECERLRLINEDKLDDFYEFNGKDARWAYGDYRQTANKIIYWGKGDVPVIPETVGQYIGLEDINGRDIYEGDIVKWGHIQGSREQTERIAIVEINPDIRFIRINCASHRDVRIFNYGSFAYKDTSKALEVIGNIHDNPELLNNTISQEVE